MAFDVNSNRYTFIFSTVMVVVVATLLALASEGLSPFQKENIKREKMQNILSSVGIIVDAADADSIYNVYITHSLILDAKGQEKAIDKKAFDIDVLKDYKSTLNRIFKKYKKGEDKEGLMRELMEADASFPLFVCKMDDGKKNYIIPMVGSGLWGPIWGYMAIEEDMNTVSGSSFDHKGETPGLGSEIRESWFEDAFNGKTIFDEKGEFVSISVIKGGAKGDPHGVDAISGGTITSDGVSEMVKRTLGIYVPFFKDKMTN